MYSNDDYEEEEQETSSGNKWRDLYENNKKLILTLGIILVAILLLSLITRGGGSSNNTEEIDVLITYRDEELQTKEISKNNTINLEATVKGVNNGIVKWTSSKPEVASVSSNGSVTGISLGTAIITATYDNNGKEISKTVEIKVSEGNSNVPVEDVYFSKGDWLMGVGTSANLRLSITPTTGYIQDRTFTSSNPSVVSVDEDGNIKALSLGNAKITASINNGRFTPSVMVYVLDGITIATQTTLVNEIKFSSTVVKIKEGEVYPLTYTVEPTNGDMTRVTWKSNNEAVATVTGNGIVKGIKEGSTIVEAYSITGATLGSVHVEVEKEIVDVSNITVLGSNNPQITLLLGQTQPITPIVKPDDASNKTLTFESSNPSVVSVSQYSGVSTVLKANSLGPAMITIKSNNGQLCIINVTVIEATNNNPGGGYDPGPNYNGGAGNSCSTKNYRFKSQDPNGNGFMNCEDLSSAEREESAGKLTVQVVEWSGSTNKLKICKYKYGSTACDPDKDTNVIVLEKNGTQVFTINENGLWAIKVSEYNGSTKVGSTLTWYANVANTSGGGGSQQQESGNGNVKITWSSKESGEVQAGLLYVRVNFATAYISNLSQNYVVRYCASSGSCSFNNNSSTNWYGRSFWYDGSGGLPDKYCISGNSNTTYYVDNKAGTSAVSYGTNGKIDFCFQPGQTVTVKVFDNNGTVVATSTKSFS